MEQRSLAGNQTGRTLAGNPAACRNLHPNAVRTGREREDISCPLWSRHQAEYRCPDCGKVFWKDIR